MIKAEEWDTSGLGGQRWQTTWNKDLCNTHIEVDKQNHTKMKISNSWDWIHANTRDKQKNAIQTQLNNAFYHYNISRVISGEWNTTVVFHKSTSYHLKAISFK